MFVAWAETMLVHGEGDLLGEPYRVPAWLQRAAWRFLEYDPVTLDFLAKEILLVCPKGSAKTEGMAALALFRLAGPALPGVDGPRMQPSANIPVAAASWDQAGKLFKHAATNMALGTKDKPSPLAAFVECFDAEIQLRPEHGSGSLYRVAAVAGTNDGGLPTCGFFDEIHEFADSRKQRVHLILSQGGDKRFGYQEVNITTPDDADPESLLGKKVLHAEKVVAGEIDDPSLYYVRYAAPDDCPLNTEDEVFGALDAAHPAEWFDLRNPARRFLSGKIPEHEFRRYWLGQFVRRKGSWLPGQAWEQRAISQEVVPLDDVPGNPIRARWPVEGTEITLGFDGSYNRDATALVGCTLDAYVFVVGVWERPEDAPDGWIIPWDEVLEAAHAAMARWTVKEMACDPYRWRQALKDMQDTYGEEVVTDFPTNSPKRMVPACGSLKAAVIDDPPRVTTDGHPVLERHLRNVVPKYVPTMDGYFITKESQDSPRKIDAAIATVIAFERAMWHAVQKATAAPSVVNLADYLDEED